MKPSIPSSGHSASSEPDRIENVLQNSMRRVLATLIRVVGDFDLAEEAAQDAYLTAVQKWHTDGIPKNPASWLISTARHKAVDLIRRNENFRRLQPELVGRVDEILRHNERVSEQEIQDDRLRLIFTCCHPAIDPNIQIPLTLREVCGLTTEEIANAFLTSPPTMAQRIARGKAKIRDAGIPFVIPSLSELPDRLDAVLSVIYLVFNEGYSASTGEELVRIDLSSEAIRLGRLVYQLLPDPEVAGLLALMLLHESRRSTRLSDVGEIVLLEDQDRTKWNKELIQEGQKLVEQALNSRQFGFYTIQAAISATHADAKNPGETDWHQIVALYTVLQQIDSSPVIELNRAVAVAMRDGPEAGLTIIQAIEERGELVDYHLLYSAQGELFRRAGNPVQARNAFQRALELATQIPERRFLQSRLDDL